MRTGRLYSQIEHINGIIIIIIMAYCAKYQLAEVLFIYQTLHNNVCGHLESENPFYVRTKPWIAWQNTQGTKMHPNRLLWYHIKWVRPEHSHILCQFAAGPSSPMSEIGKVCIRCPHELRYPQMPNMRSCVGARIISNKQWQMAAPRQSEAAKCAPHFCLCHISRVTRRSLIKSLSVFFFSSVNFFRTCCAYEVRH